MLFALIDDVQKRRNIGGDVFEIGCHHGKSAVFLANLVDHATETLGVCDLFENQAENRSNSGAGDRKVFEETMQPAVDAGLKLEVFGKNSAELQGSEIGQNIRFFHVDGGHSLEEALGDIKLAAECLSPAGVIAVDDPFSAPWPGVTEAVIRFLDERGDFQAFVVGFNKLLICRTSAVDEYVTAIWEEYGERRFGLGQPLRIWERDLCGRPMLAYSIPSVLKRGGPRALIMRTYLQNPWMRERLPKPVRTLVRRVTQGK